MSKTKTNQPRIFTSVQRRRHVRIPRRFAAVAVVAALALVTARIWAQRVDQQPDGISPEGRAQIEALLREKESRSPAERKIDSQLLYAQRMEQGLPIADGIWTLDVDLPYASDGHVIVDVKATATNDLANQLAGFTAEVVRMSPGNLQMHVDLSQVEAIASNPDVLFVQPQQRAFTSRAGARQEAGQRKSGASRRAAAADAIRGALSQHPSTLIGTGQGSTTSQADITHRSAVFRGLTGFNGAGVKVGVLSDGVEHLADAQASGDLGAVTVLPGQAGSGDEGTAMLELIHDIAPGAQLYFATAFTSITSFADNIRALRTAGCDIIVDDVGYYVESPFQDGQGPSVVSPTNGGVVTQAVKDVAALGAMYFSSAGNSGNLNDGTSGVWEGDFNLGAATVNPPITSAGNFHRFTGAQDYNVLNLAGSGPISLAWSNPLGGSGNDYDIFRLNTAMTAVAASSTNIQNGNDDPYEQMSNSTASPRIVIVKKTGAANRFLHLNTNRGQLSVATAGQTHGHAATSNIFTFGVAAAYAGFAFPSPFSTSNVVETFSSDGPRRVFFLGDGTPVTPGNFGSTGGAVLQKPDLTAADGTFVTGAGDFPGQFFGTSAAAPHAAAILALIKSANPSFTQTQLRSALFSSALDIEAPGVDRDSGIGIVMALAPQPGCTFGMAPSLVNIGAAGGPAGTSVTASSGSCNWAAWSNVSWINVSGGIAVGSGGLGFYVAANPGPARTGTITIQGGQIVTVSQTGSPATTSSISPALAIPDNTTVESPLVVSGFSGPIVNLSASFYLTHTFDADLTITLIGPDATAIPLSIENGGSANNYGSACSPVSSNTTFDDSAANLVAHGSAPFVGSFRPERPLSAFNGKGANGTWKLRITDSFAGDTGTLVCWSLNINQGPPVPPTAVTSGATLISSSGATLNGTANPNGAPTTGQFQYGLTTGYGQTTAPQSLGSGGIAVSIGGGRIAGLACNTTYHFRAFANNGGGPAVGADAAFTTATCQTVPGDYDGDRKGDLTVFRPSTGVWHILRSGSGTSTAFAWGNSADRPVVGDYDGDGVIDVAVFRPSNGTWYVVPSSTGVPFAYAWGNGADIPVPGDYDGDKRTDVAVFRPSNGTWYVVPSTTGIPYAYAWGNGADVAVPGDYDGDGKTDIAVFRPSNGTWYVVPSRTGVPYGYAWGNSADKPVAADYDADGQADIAVFRPSTGTWFVVPSTTGVPYGFPWGNSADIPVPVDYDGDMRTDIAVFRPSNGTWYIVPSTTGVPYGVQWGLTGDIPIRF